MEDCDGYTVDEALSTVGFGRFQIIALGFAGLGWISDAMEMMLLSFIGPALQSQWTLSPNQESFLSTIVFIGMLFGAYFWGFISDLRGRGAGFIGAAGILSALSPNYEALLISRCFLGFGVGGAQVFAAWFLEFIPTSNRGSWMVAISSFWTLGTITQALLAWIVMPRLGWRWLLALSSIPSISVTLFSLFMPESPRYLCSKGKPAEARRILEKVAKLNLTTLGDANLLSDQKTMIGSDPSEETLLSSTKVQTHAYFKSLRELFSPELLKTTLLVWFLYFGYTFSYYGIVLITSSLSDGQNECNSRATSSKNVEESNLYFDTFITSIAEFPGLVIVALVVNRLGRKMTMQVMTMFTFVLMLPLLWHQNEVITTTLLFGARMFTSAGFSVANVYSKEVYPTSARTTGDGLANAMGRIGGMVCPLIAVGLVRGCHQPTAVLLFEIVLIVSGLCILLLPLETKGRGLVDSIRTSSNSTIDL